MFSHWVQLTASAPLATAATSVFALTLSDPTYFIIPRLSLVAGRNREAVADRKSLHRAFLQDPEPIQLTPAPLQYIGRRLQTGLQAHRVCTFTREAPPREGPGSARVAKG